MGIFNRNREKAENNRLMERLDGRRITYAARRTFDEAGNPIEQVIGRLGSINTREGRIVIICDGAEVFRCPAEGASCSELLSLDGVVIQGNDTQTGEPVTVVAKYPRRR